MSDKLDMEMEKAIGELNIYEYLDLTDYGDDSEELVFELEKKFKIFIKDFLLPDGKKNMFLFNMQVLSAMCKATSDYLDKGEDFLAEKYADAYIKALEKFGLWFDKEELNYE